MNKKLLIPLGVFALLCAFLFAGLRHDPRRVPSPLIGKPVPDFALTQLHDPSKLLGSIDMKGQVWLLNIWASWCAPCRQEHPLLIELAKAGITPIIGLQYKDDPETGKAWLARNGNPYVTSVADRDGRVGLDFGVYGVPETFVIDKKGLIRYKQIGPITPDVLDKTIVPLIRELQES